MNAPRVLSVIALAASLFLVLVTLSQAAGLAVAQAPEAGIGVCFGDDATEAIDCAQAMCAAESGLPLDHCTPQIWCGNALWAADIFMQHEEGPHWHDYLCGWASRDQLQAAIDLKCDSPWLIECTPVAIWTPEGVEIDLP